jgi:hypothetical protein
MPFSLRPTAAVIGLYRRVTSGLRFTPVLYVLDGIGLVWIIITIGPYLPASVLWPFPPSEPAIVKGALACPGSVVQFL